MTIDQIKTLAKGSFKGENLDPKMVLKITKLLTRNDLKLYVKALKSEERKRRVTVFLPNIKLSDKQVLQKKIAKLFPNKKIEFSIDPSLLVGLKIVDDDMIYEYNLKNTLESLSNYLESQYD